jgi:hypothetical protein
MTILALLLAVALSPARAADAARCAQLRAQYKAAVSAFARVGPQMQWKMDGCPGAIDAPPPVDPAQAAADKKKAELAAAEKAKKCADIDKELDRAGGGTDKYSAQVREIGFDRRNSLGCPPYVFKKR